GGVPLKKADGFVVENYQPARSSRSPILWFFIKVSAEMCITGAPDLARVRVIAIKNRLESRWGDKSGAA
ncbi:MAG: hypothetical protein ACO3JW_09930, partial [Vulcanococcus sp.]